MTTYEDILNHPYWRHRIRLNQNKYVPGTKDASHWDALGMPEHLSGKSFLDIGAFDGLHSFEAERRGAEHVLATDVWDVPEYDKEWWSSLRPGKQGFDLVHDYIDSDVESKTIGVESISPDTVGQFDIVLCSGIIYHLKEPFSAIENVVSVANEKVIIESAIQSDFNPPGLKFLKGTERDNNPSTWWVPNLNGLEDMVSAAGCRNTSVHHPPINEANSPLPPTKSGVITNSTSAYESPNLNQKVDEIENGTKITLLMTYEGAERIEYREGQAKKQGWVSQNSVCHTNGLSNLLTASTRTLKNEGPISFANNAYTYIQNNIQNRPSRGIVHGHL